MSNLTEERETDTERYRDRLQYTAKPAFVKELYRFNTSSDLLTAPVTCCPLQH